MSVTYSKTTISNYEYPRYFGYLKPTQSFISFTHSDDQITHLQHCRRYNVALSHISDKERNFRIKSARKILKKLYLTDGAKASRSLATKSASILSKRKIADDFSISNEEAHEEYADEIFEKYYYQSNFKNRLTQKYVNQMSSTVSRHSSPQHFNNARVSANKSLKSIHLNELSLSDLCTQPKKPHTIAFMSPEAQISMLRSYEQLIREKLLKICLDSSDEVSMRCPTPSYLIHSNEINNIKDFTPNQSQITNEHETRRMKISHFLETATRILDIIETNQKMASRKNDSICTNTYRDRFPIITPSAHLNDPLEEPLDDPFELYSRWVYLLNKEFKK